MGKTFTNLKPIIFPLYSRLELCNLPQSELWSRWALTAHQLWTPAFIIFLDVAKMTSQIFWVCCWSSMVYACRLCLFKLETMFLSVQRSQPGGKI